MKNYIELLTDEEIKSYILEYLKITGWKGSCEDLSILSLDKIDDIVVKRYENYFFAELYFNHKSKFKSDDIHTQYVYLDKTPIKIFEEFSGDSFHLSGFELNNKQVDKLIFGDKDKDLVDEYGDEYHYSIHEDLNKYWNHQLYKKFGKEYLQDLKSYRRNIIKEEYNKKEMELDKYLKSILKTNNKIDKNSEYEQTREQKKKDDELSM